jgi:hypothetical protein
MDEINNQLVLISGESGSGKSASLRNIQNQDKWMYLNCEAGKRLPFKNQFQTFNIVDPYQVWEGFDHAMANPDKFHGIALDTATFLMEMMESVHVLTSNDTQKAWGHYAQFWKHLMQKKVVEFGKPVLIFGHTRTELDEQTHTMKTAVPVKGSLRNNGIEAYFSTVVSTKKVPLNELEKYGSNLLTITEEDKDLGYKHVFQTRLTKQTVGERIRSPMGMFNKEHTYIDNDCQLLLGHLKEFYGD